MVAGPLARVCLAALEHGGIEAGPERSGHPVGIGTADLMEVGEGLPLLEDELDLLAQPVDLRCLLGAQDPAGDDRNQDRERQQSRDVEVRGAGDAGTSSRSRNRTWIWPSGE